MDDRVNKAVSRAQQEAEAIERMAKGKNPASMEKPVAPTPRALERMWKRILNK